MSQLFSEPNQTNIRVIPTGFNEQRNLERVRSHKGMIYQRGLLVDGEASEDSYKDSYIFDCRLLKHILIHVLEVGGTNGITFKVLACVDPKHWETLQDSGVSEFAVSASGSKVLDFTVAWSFAKIQFKSTTPASAGKVLAYMAGKTP